MKILIADDHSVVRQGVSLMLRDAFADVEIKQADSFYDTLTAVKEDAFDLLLLDINIPGGNNASMIGDIKSVNSDVNILMFSAYDEEHYALRYMQAGASGYINKLSSEEKIIEAINTVLNGNVYFSESLQSVNHGVNNNPLNILSKRELEITLLLIKGEGNLDIANRLKIGMSTVSTYKSRIFEKLGVTNVVTLAEKYWLYNN